MAVLEAAAVLGGGGPMRRLSAPITRLACRSLPASLISPLLLAQCPRQRRVLQLARVPSRCHPTGSFAAADPPPAELHRQVTQLRPNSSACLCVCAFARVDGRVGGQGDILRVCSTCLHCTVSGWRKAAAAT